MFPGGAATCTTSTAVLRATACLGCPLRCNLLDQSSSLGLKRNSEACCSHCVLGSGITAVRRRLSNTQMPNVGLGEKSFDTSCLLVAKPCSRGVRTDMLCVWSKPCEAFQSVRKRIRSASVISFKTKWRSWRSIDGGDTVTRISPLPPN